MFTHTSITKFFNLRFFLLGVAVVGLCALFWPALTSAQSNGGINIGSVLEYTLWAFVNALFGWMVWFGAMLLDLSVNQFVIGFGNLYTGTSGLGDTIDRLWVVVRDIFNLTFIFGLVYIGLKMIFDSSNSSTRKMLVMLILAALLVNFSLFITKFVIDFSNVAAAQIATGFQVGGTGGAQVSARFMDLMGLTSIWQSIAGQTIDFSQMKGGAGLGYILGTMILYIVAAFVFLGGGLLLMIRFVVLNIYMVLSPLMFIGWVFPSAASVTREYWHGFLNRAFFAPAYLLMLYLAQSVLTTFAVTATSNNGLSSLFGPTGPTSFAQVAPPFILTSVFLIAALIVAQKMGANGASGVISMGKTLTGKAKKVVADRTIGVGARGVARALNSQPVTRFNARVNQSVDNFTNRQTRAGRILAGGAVEAANIATLGVFSRKNRHAAIQGSNNLSLAGSQSLSAMQKEERDIRITDSKILTAATNSQNFERNLGVLNDNNSALGAVTQALTDLGATLRGMSNDERANLDIQQLTNPHVAAHLTDSHITALESSGNFSPAQINQMRAARTAAQNNIAQHGFATVTAGVPSNVNFANYWQNRPAAPAPGAQPSQAYTDFQNHNSRAIEQTLLRGGVEAAGNLPPGVFALDHMYEFITPAMLERRIQNGNITNTEMANIRTAIETYLGNANTPQNVVRAWENWSNTRPAGIRLGLNIPNANQNQAGGNQNNNPGPVIEVPLNVGNGPRPRA